MPKVLPLPIMLVQRAATLAASPKLRVEGVNGVSVTAVPVGLGCTDVPQAANPSASVAVVTAVEALFVQSVPLPPVPATVDNNFTAIEPGRTPVSVLLVRSFTTDNEASPFGVTRQEQQEISCSSGENAYTLTQILPTLLPNPGPNKDAPVAPVFVMLMTPSPRVRLDV